MKITLVPAWKWFLEMNDWFKIKNQKIV
jgi:hypothetical protein